MTKTEQYCYDQGRIEERKRIVAVMQVWWTNITTITEEAHIGLLKIIQGEKL